MRPRQIFSIAAVIASALATSTSAQSYFSADTTVTLKIDSFKVVMKFDEGQSPDQVLSKILRVVKIVPEPDMLSGFVACSLRVKEGYDLFIDSLRRTDGIYLAEPYFCFQSGAPAPVGEAFVVAFERGTLRSSIDSLNKRFHVMFGSQLEEMTSTFILRNTDSSGHNLLEMVNLYHGLKDVRYSHPLFGSRPKAAAYRLYDYFHTYQPHTKKVIGSFDSASVWDFAGLTNPVIVAVLDDGIAPHEDLPETRIQTGRDFTYQWHSTPGEYQSHGMACAGIIAATHTTDSTTGLQDSSGIISLNPHVRIVSVRIADDTGGFILLDSIAPAIRWAVSPYWGKAAILSCSWGGLPGLGGSQTFEEAIKAAVDTARDGRGCPVIFASGNLQGKVPGVGYPARLPDCMAVGATHLDDTRWT